MGKQLIYIALALGSVILLFSAAHQSLKSNILPYQSSFETPALKQSQDITCPADFEFDFTITFVLLNYQDYQVQSILDTYQQCENWSSISSLTIYLAGNSLTSIDCLIPSISAIMALRTLEINIESNKITDDGLKNFKSLITSKPSLEVLKVVLSGNRITSTDFLQGALDKSVVLSRFTIDLSSNSLTEASAFTTLFKKLANVDYLSISMADNTLTTLDDFSSAFDSLINLSYMIISLNNNVISDISAFNTSFAKLRNLEFVFFNLAYNRITNIDALSRTFSVTRDLTYLNLNLWGNKITSVQALQTAFLFLNNLQQFYLYLVSNQIRDVTPLQYSFLHFDSIQGFLLDLQSNKINVGADLLADAIAAVIGEQLAFCPFQFNISQNPLTGNQLISLKAVRDDLTTISKQAKCPYPDFQFVV